MLTLEPESEAAISLETLSNKGPISLTAFSKLIAAQISSSKEQTTAQIYEHPGISSKRMIEEVSRILNFQICLIQRFLQVLRAIYVEILNLGYINFT